MQPEIMWSTAGAPREQRRYPAAWALGQSTSVEAALHLLTFPCIVSAVTRYRLSFRADRPYTEGDPDDRHAAKKSAAKRRVAGSATDCPLRQAGSRQVESKGRSKAIKYV